MVYMIRKLEEYERWGYLTANTPKTKYLGIRAEAENLIMKDEKKATSCKEYKYLGTILNRGETEDQEISNRKPRRIIACLNGILWSKSIIEKRKFNIYETMAKSVMPYGCMETN